jgi:hypothetical protein
MKTQKPTQASWWLLQAAEAPVIDTSCAALMQLARRVHANGQKVVLTGEGADEWLAGYPWYKIAKILGILDVVPGMRLSDKVRRAFLRFSKVPQYPAAFRHSMEECVGGPNAWIDSYGVLGLAKLRFYAEPMQEVLAHAHPWAGLGINLERASRWHPLNRGLWVGARVTLAGHLLQAKGDRVAMHSSVEVRYPFLDEDVFDFTARLHPRWKLRGFRDKHLLRLVAERWLPPSIARRHKVIFRAPLDSFHIDPEPKYVGELLSDESLRRTGYFDVAAVRTGGKPTVRCEPVPCRASPSKWASPPSSPPSCGITPSSTVRWRISPVETHPPASSFACSAYFRQRLFAFRFQFRIVILLVRHRQTLFEEQSRLGVFAHLCIGASQFDVMAEPVRIDGDGTIKARHRCFIGSHRQLAINETTQSVRLRVPMPASTWCQRPAHARRCHCADRA